MNGLRASLAESEERNEELKSKNAEQRAELRQYLDQYQWQFQAGAGSNAEAREPEVKARGSGSLPGRIAEDEKEWPDETASVQAKSPTPRNVVTGELVDQRAKEADRIDLASWPKPGTFRVWRMNLVDRIVATSSRPQGAFRWITALSKPDVTYEDMADTSDGGSVSFSTLDAKLVQRQRELRRQISFVRSRSRKRKQLLRVPWLQGAKSYGSWTVTSE